MLTIIEIPVYFSGSGRGKPRYFGYTECQLMNGSNPVAICKLDSNDSEQNKRLAHLFAAAPELLAACREPMPSALPGGTFADDLFTVASILEETPYPEVAEKLRAKAKAMLAAIAKAEGKVQP